MSGYLIWFIRLPGSAWEAPDIWTLPLPAEKPLKPPSLDPTTAPSITFSHVSSALAAVDLLLVLEMRPGTLPGSRVKSSRLKLKTIRVIWTLSYFLTRRPCQPKKQPPAMIW